MHLYVHIPFCARRCSYCDFAIAVRRVVPAEEYAVAVLAEWREGLTRSGWPDDRELTTLYFGGGTPSLLDPRWLEAVTEGITLTRPLAADAEVTLEANPDDVTAERAAAWRRLGVNRVSLGVQSFAPAALAWMHRTHRADQVAPAVAALRQAGIVDISLDLIFGLPGTVERDWRADLAATAALAPTHLSLYGLTVEPHTPLARWVTRGATVAAGEGRYADEFLAGDAFLRSEGFVHYEVSNACRPGHRARHNSAYWRRAPYVGLGPSAHSAWGNGRRWNLREWEAYRSAVARGELPVAGEEVLDPTAIALEELYLGLRTDAGVAVAAIPRASRVRWEDAGWATVSADRIRLTPTGWLRLDALVLEAAGSLSPSPEPS